MKIDTARRVTTLVAACALSACGGSSATSANGAASSAQAAASRPATNPCRLPGLWTFGGACVSGEVTAAGGTFVLPSYRNIAATVAYGKNDAKGRVTFVIGDATGDGDITGRLNGKQPFPFYASASCLSPSGAGMVCDGKAILYLLVINASNVPVHFAASPRIQIWSLGGIATKVCQVRTMAWTRGQAQPVWRGHAWSAQAIGKTVTFEPLRAEQGYKSQGALVAYVVTC